MNLTQYTDYSLRVLMYLAVTKSNQLANIEEIANVYGISANHLRKVVYHLAQLDLIETVRGRNGGIRLAKEPRQVNVGWVVRQMEEGMHIVECSKDSSVCALGPICKLRKVLEMAADRFLLVLDEYTLENLIENEQELKQIFKVKG